MGDLKLTSASGSVTLSPENVAGTTTITVPSSTATLATNENFTSTGIDDNATSTAITIDSSENVSIDTGNLVIGTSGKGIDFSATSDGSGTMTSELLDDYEEGTWTPTVHDSTTEASEGQTYAHNDGYYTKIGNTVHCWGKLQITSLGTMNTNSGVHIHGLPFATSSNTYFRAVTVFGYGASLAQSTAASLSGYSLPSSNNIYVLNWDTNSGITTLTIGELSVNANLHWYTVYRV